MAPNKKQTNKSPPLQDGKIDDTVSLDGGAEGVKVVQVLSVSYSIKFPKLFVVLPTSTLLVAM
jgi:hypothetical protein